MRFIAKVPMKKDMKIAVLIDAENISHKYAHTILQEASSLGNVIYKRIYGNWMSTQLGPWKKELLDHAIQPIQQFSNTTGKNSSDSALIIDAMDLLYQNDLDAFCIVSSDSDFTRLATRLRESDIFVLGMGEQKTPRAFISACNKFVYLDVLEESHKRETSKSNPRTRKRTNAAPERTKQDQTSTTDSSDRRKQVRSERLDAPSSSSKNSTNEALLPVETQAEEPAVYSDGTDIIDVTDALINIIEEYSDDEGWIPASYLASLVSRRFNDFDTRNFGFKKFVPFVESLKLFEKRTGNAADGSNVRTIFFRLIED